MNLQTATIQLPKLVYQRLERAAVRQNRSVAHVVESAIDRMEPLMGIPTEELRELDALPYLSNNSLWVLAQQLLTSEQQREWEQLNDQLQRSGHLSVEEERRSKELLALYDYVVLRRAIVLRLLQQRGQDISSLLAIPKV